MPFISWLSGGQSTGSDGNVTAMDSPGVSTKDDENLHKKNRGASFLSSIIGSPMKKVKTDVAMSDPTDNQQEEDPEQQQEDCEEQQEEIIPSDLDVIATKREKNAPSTEATKHYDNLIKQNSKQYNDEATTREQRYDIIQNIFDAIYNGDVCNKSKKPSTLKPGQSPHGRYLKRIKNPDGTYRYIKLTHEETCTKMQKAFHYQKQKFKPQRQKSKLIETELQMIHRTRGQAAQANAQEKDVPNRKKTITKRKRPLQRRAPARKAPTPDDAQMDTTTDKSTTMAEVDGAATSLMGLRKAELNTTKIYPVGTQTKRYFEEFEGWFQGTIRSYNALTKFYSVEYEDSDTEDLEYHEIDTEPLPPNQYNLGTHVDVNLVSKENGKDLGWYQGTIKSKYYHKPKHAKSQGWRYNLVYHDGDSEDVSEDYITDMIDRARRIGRKRSVHEEVMEEATQDEDDGDSNGNGIRKKTGSISSPKIITVREQILKIVADSYCRGEDLVKVKKLITTINLKKATITKGINKLKREEILHAPEFGYVGLSGKAVEHLGEDYKNLSPEEKRARLRELLQGGGSRSKEDVAKDLGDGEFTVGKKRKKKDNQDTRTAEDMDEDNDEDDDKYEDEHMDNEDSSSSETESSSSEENDDDEASSEEDEEDPNPQRIPHWTGKQHHQFLLGLRNYGLGNLQEIHEANCIPQRSFGELIRYWEWYCKEMKSKGFVLDYEAKGTMNGKKGTKVVPVVHNDSENDEEGKDSKEDFRRGEWSAEEKEMVVKAFVYDGQTYVAMSKYMKTRSPNQIRRYWKKFEKEIIEDSKKYLQAETTSDEETAGDDEQDCNKSKFWTFAERLLLSQAIAIYGHQWKEVAAYMKSRGPAQIQGYVKRNSQSIKKTTEVQKSLNKKLAKRTGTWTNEELSMLVEGHSIFDKDFDRIAAYVKTRNASDVRILLEADPLQYKDESGFDLGDHFSFPIELFHVLNVAPFEGFSHILSWTDDGESVVITDKDQFSAIVFPKYSHKGISVEKFYDNLKLFGFERNKKGNFFHPAFQRGNYKKVEQHTRKVYQ